MGTDGLCFYWVILAYSSSHCLNNGFDAPVKSYERGTDSLGNMHRVWGLLCKDKKIQDTYHSASRQTGRALLLSSRHSYCARSGPHNTSNELLAEKTGLILERASELMTYK